MDKGSYCLILAGGKSCIRIGSLGETCFHQGWYVYCGSAQGPGGLARVRRHIRVSKRGVPSPTWHIDYLLSSPEFHLEAVVCVPGRDPETECHVASSLSGRPFFGFGCSDCRCHSHLFFYPEDPKDEVLSAILSLGLPATIKTIN
ncbi:MAG: GIY-YIG nuclease family protein [Methanoregulaceae archaeon]|nr:GIY-YIG nuclease family protein [Methanoregulaceae archaeon]